MNIEHISVSRYKCYDLCAAQYRFKYHLKEVPEGEEPFYFVYGKIVHKIAEEYVSRQGQDNINDLAKEVLKGGIEIEPGAYAPKLPPEYEKRLPNHLRNIRRITEKLGFEGKIEHPFYFDIDPPNGRHIKGFIDRLIQKGDKFYILDYKTTKKSRWRAEGRALLHDLQLRAYAWIVQQEFGAAPENINCALYYLDEGELHGARYSQKSLDEVIDVLRNAYIEIEKADPDKVYGNVGDHCRRCDYRKMCKFYSLTGEGL